MRELTDEQWQHLVGLLLQRLTDSDDFRIGVAIGLASKFTPEQYEEYVLEFEEEEA